MIYHLMERSDWERAERTGTGVVPGEGESFLHCCDQGQLHQVVTGWFAAGADVVALVLDPTRVAGETRYEPGSAGEPERFPHLYGSIRPQDVVGVEGVEPIDGDRPR